MVSWLISSTATKFCEKYYGEQGANTTMSALSCLNQLCSANNLLLDEVIIIITVIINSYYNCCCCYY